MIILAFMLILPLSVMKKPEAEAAATSAKAVSPKKEVGTAQVFRISDAETDTVTEMPPKEYIFGVVAAEMPALYDEEALKAQAVAAYTFACYRRAENADKAYDLTTDFSTDQSFISEEKAREKWGDKADEYCKKLKNAIDAVENLAVTYDGKPILAVYHALSSGKTEDCKNVWGGAYPYLKAAASPGDILAPDYISKAVFFRRGGKKQAFGKVRPFGRAFGLVQKSGTHPLGYGYRHRSRRQYAQRERNAHAILASFLKFRGCL